MCSGAALQSWACGEGFQRGTQELLGSGDPGCLSEDMEVFEGGRRAGLQDNQHQPVCTGNVKVALTLRRQQDFAGHCSGWKV